MAGTGASAHRFDTIYDFGGLQPLKVATAAPGDRGYNSGRWMVHALADDRGADLGVVKLFVCPVIPVP